jgi:hypothetical protein
VDFGDGRWDVPFNFGSRRLLSAFLGFHDLRAKISKYGQGSFSQMGL